MKHTAWIFLCVLLLAATGCTYLRGYADIAKEKGMSGEYLTALKTWTRDQTIHSQFETKVLITATWKSEDFRRAYIREYERIYPMEPQQKQKWEETQAGLASDFMEFVFYAYVPEREANDFDRNNSVWTVFLIDEQGRRENPVEIRRMDKVTSVTEAFFPYINKYYGVFYSLKFSPRKGQQDKSAASPARSVRLVMSSVLGRIELGW